MTVFARRTTVEEDAPGKLLEQFKDKTRLEAFLGAFLAPIQPLEDALWQLATERTLATAVGAQLDIIGRIVGRGRAGLADDAYRAVLRAQIRVLLSSGKPEELLTITRLVLNVEAPGPVTWRELYPAAGEMVVDAVPPVDPELMVDMLQDARSGGVRLYMSFPRDSETEADAFAYATGDSEESAPTEGWADVWGPSVFDEAALHLAAFTAEVDGSEWPTLQGRVASATQATPVNRPDLVLHDPRFGLMPSIEAPAGRYMTVPHHADMSITASGFYLAVVIASESDDSGNENIISKWDSGLEWSLYLSSGAPRWVVRNSANDGSAIATWGAAVRDGEPHVVEAYHDGGTALGVSVDGGTDVTAGGSFRSDTGDVFLFAETAVSAAADMATPVMLMVPRMPSAAERAEILDHLRSMHSMSGGTYPGGRIYDVIT